MMKEANKLNRNSRSWDLAVGLPGLKPLKSTPVLKLEGDFRKVSLSSVTKSSPEQKSLLGLAGGWVKYI
jgi:hypothetical protein